MSLRDVRVQFGGVLALNLSTLDLPPTFGLAALFVGPNGAGKTTLLNAISGYVPITKGKILFGGETRLDRLSKASIVRAGVVRTFQTPLVFESLTVREGISLAALAGQKLTIGTRTRMLMQRPTARYNNSDLVGALIHELGLNQVADTLTRELPLSLIRRAEIARSLAAQPRVLLLDEPTAGADDHEWNYLAGLLSSGLVALVTRLSNAGLYRHNALTMCLITHDMSFARRLVRASAEPPIAFFLDQGTVVTSGLLDVVTGDSRVLNTYLAEEQHVDA